MEKTKVKKIIIISVITALLTTLCVFHGILSVTSKKAPEFIECNMTNLDGKYKTVVDKKFNKYLGHPDLVEIDGRLMTFYPSGHGKGAIIGKYSDDLGETWQTIDNLPESWENSMETPCVYKLNMRDGRKVLLITSGCPNWNDIGARPDGFNCSVSFDKGETWSEFTHWYGKEEMGGEGYDGVVAMSSLTQLKENGEYVDKWMGTFHRGAHDYGIDAGAGYMNYKTILTFDGDNPQWSVPQPILEEHHELEDKYGMCELEIIRNEKDNCLIMLARANRRVSNSLICYSYDEGETWSEPKELPYCLTGDRHKAEIDLVTGKVLVSFRQVLQNGKKFKPNMLSSVDCLSRGWVAWVGDFDDLMSYADDDPTNDTYGDLFIHVGRNYGGTDCGYSGVVCLEDGTFVMTSYGKFKVGALNPYIICAKFKLSDVKIGV
ncbi:MAG: glycoside hydrolase [Clostridia bacterium]|nr:glycoside hydrolase [Clostridia bacterium]MDE7215979.1 glycoside hydrolase [Clostridia bacterium]